MTVIPLPRHGRWAWDLRGEGRGVRVSAHVDEGLLNLSLWRGGACVGTAQLLPGDVAKLVSGLSEGLAVIAAQPRTREPEGGGAGRLDALELRLAGVEARLAASARRGPRERAGAAVRTVHAALVARRPGILGVRR